MHAAYEKLFQWRAVLLMSERYDDLANQYSPPIEIVLVGQRANLKCRDDLALYFRRYHIALRDRGVDSLAARVVAVGLPAGQEQRVWVRWAERNHAGFEVGVSQAVYTCVQTRGGPLTSKIHYTQSAMPDHARPLLRKRLAAMR
jgi:hypothetical protein